MCIPTVLDCKIAFRHLSNCQKAREFSISSRNKGNFFTIAAH